MAIRTPTVLILGAGASLHCGYPLGLQLISDVASLRQKSPYLPLPARWSHEDLERFITRLSRSGHYSIDAFLEIVPPEIELGKYLIAYCLKQKEDIDRLFPPYDSGWYQYLFNCLLNNDTAPFSNNQLTIVTYNYDRSLEAYIYEALMARFSMTPDEAKVELAKVPIIHVHGSIGVFPEIPYSTSKDIDVVSEIARCITIIHEIHDHDQEGEFCNEEFRLANLAINNASRIVFLGFGFHYDNVRRLKVEWSTFCDRTVRSTFWDTSTEEYARIMRRLSDLGLSQNILPMTGGNSCNGFFRFEFSLE